MVPIRSELILYNQTVTIDISSIHWTNILAGVGLYFVVLVTLVGNIMVLIAVTREKRLHTVFNYYIVNLAVTDVAVAVTAMSFNTINTVLGYWPFGQFMCGVWIFFDYGMTFASVFTLLVISVDRFWSVSWSMHYRLHHKKKKAFIAIFFVWVTILTLLLPAVIVDRLHKHSENICIWAPDENREFAIVIAIIGHHGSCVILVFCYVHVYLFMRKRLIINKRRRSLGSLRSSTSIGMFKRQKRFARRLMSRFSLETSLIGSLSEEKFDAVIEAIPENSVAVDTRQDTTNDNDTRLDTANANDTRLDTANVIDTRLDASNVIDPQSLKSEDKSKNVSAKEDEIQTKNNDNVVNNEVKPSEGLEKPSEGLEKPSISLEKPSVSLEKPSEGLERPSESLERPSEGLDKPSEGEDTEELEMRRNLQKKIIESMTSELPGFKRRPFESMSVKTVTIAGSEAESRSLSLADVEEITERRERKVFQLLTCIICCYIICWVPFHIVFDICVYDPNIVPKSVYIITSWLTYLNSTINPFLYNYSSTEFRRAFRSILHLKPETKKVRKRQLGRVR